MLNIKIDTKLKMQAKKTADELGIPLGTIASALLRQFVREKEITLSVAHTPSASLIESIKEAQKEYASGDLKSYKGTKELFKGLAI